MALLCLGISISKLRRIFQPSTTFGPMLGRSVSYCCNAVLASIRRARAGDISRCVYVLRGLLTLQCRLPTSSPPECYLRDLRSFSWRLRHSDGRRGARLPGSAASGSLRAAIRASAGAFPFDVVQSGYTIRFQRRQRCGAVLCRQTDARAFDLPLACRRSLPGDGHQLPAKVTVKYLDADREYA